MLPQIIDNPDDIDPILPSYYLDESTIFASGPS